MTQISRKSQLHFAREMCRKDALAGAQLWAMVQPDRRIVPVLVPAGPEQDRAIDLLILQHLAKRLGAVRAFMMMEAWVTEYERQIGETDAEHRERSLAVPPRKSERRREAINLLDLRKGKLPVQVMQWIERDDQGRPHFPEPPITQRGAGLESGWLLVLDDPPPFPPGELGELMRDFVDRKLAEVMTVKLRGDA